MNRDQALEDINTTSLDVFIRDAMHSFILNRINDNLDHEEGIRQYVFNKYSWMTTEQQAMKIDEVKSRIRLARLVASVATKLTPTLHTLLKEQIDKETTT